MNNFSIYNVYNFLQDRKQGREVKFVDMETRKVIPFLNGGVDRIKDLLDGGKKIAAFSSLNGEADKVCLLSKDEPNGNGRDLDCTVSNVFDAEGIDFSKKPNGFVRFFHKVNKFFGGKGFKSCNDYEKSVTKLNALNEQLENRLGDKKFEAPNILDIQREEAKFEEKQSEIVIENQKAQEKEISAPKFEIKLEKAPVQEKEKLTPPTEKTSPETAFKYYDNLLKRMQNEDEAYQKANGPCYGEAYREAYPEINHLDDMLVNDRRKYEEYTVRKAFLDGIKAKRDMCRFVSDREAHGKRRSEEGYRHSNWNLTGDHRVELSQAQLAATAIATENKQLAHIINCSKELKESLYTGLVWEPKCEDIQKYFGENGPKNILKDTAAQMKSQNKEHLINNVENQAEKEEAQEESFLEI